MAFVPLQLLYLRNFSLGYSLLYLFFGDFGFLQTPIQNLIFFRQLLQLFLQSLNLHILFCLQIVYRFTLLFLNLAS